MCGRLNALNRFKRYASWMVVITVFSTVPIYSSTSWSKNNTPPSPAVKPVETTEPVLDGIGLDQIKAKLSVVEGSQGLGESIKKSALSLLDQAIRFREMADQINRETDENTQKIVVAPKRLKAIETERVMQSLANDQEPFGSLGCAVTIHLVSHGDWDAFAYSGTGGHRLPL